MAEKKYIELKKALNVCNMHYQHYLLETDFDKCTVVECVVDDIETIPIADVVEVRHGTWIWAENGEEDYEQYWICSVCGEKEYFKTNYCSDCGAKMDGRRDT